MTRHTIRPWFGLAGLLACVGLSSAAEAKVGLVQPANAGPALKADLEKLASESGEVVSGKALAKGNPPKATGARATWASSAARSAGVNAVIIAEFKGKQLRLQIFADGKLNGEDVFNAKPKAGLDADTKVAIRSFFANALAGGGIAAPSAPTPRNAPAVAPPPTAPPPTAPPPTAPPPVATNERVDTPPSSTSPTAATAVVPPPSGSHGGGLLGKAMGIAPGLPPLALVTVEFLGVGRGFNYTDPITANLRPFNVTFMPSPSFGLALYPLTLSGSARAAAFGIHGGFATSLGVKSSRVNGPEYPTTYTRFDVGAHYRIFLGDTFDSFAVIPKFGFHGSGLSLGAASDGSKETELPSTAYTGLSMGLGLDIPVAGLFHFVGEGNFVLVFSSGDPISAAYFRAGSTSGVTASAGIKVGLSDAFSIVAGVNYQHYAYAFKPNPGDKFVAGGALDQFLAGRLGVEIGL
ncbi:MAG: hypothetical protein U1E65_14965 [Myxococcota bacterium]